MKNPVPLLTVTLVLAATIDVRAEELSAEALHGKWLYTHILMDGTREIQVNYLTEFFPDGSVAYFDGAGVEKDRGRYVVSGDAIIYTDEKGEQVWKLVSLSEGKLHVDHRGAEMFFERQ